MGSEFGVGVAGDSEWASYMRAGIDVWAGFHSNERRNPARLAGTLLA